jgi:peptidoglycan/xylan/chitin deacetylase (PgdA/CDA1 family)
VPFFGKETLLSTAERVDELLSPIFGASGSGVPEDTVSAFLFHRFLRDEELQNGPGVYPHEGVTISIFESVVALIRKRGFNFVLPSDIASGAVPPGRSALLTVDDGYADNLRMLDVLQKHRAKAVLFVSAAHVQRNERFWPDALWIGARSRRWSRMRTARAARVLINLSPAEVARSLREWFGEDILQPSGFIDRPLNRNELKLIAQSPLVEIGSHAFDHTTLSPRPIAFVSDQLKRSIEYLEPLTGRRPTALAYPNGVYSKKLLQECRNFGFKTGFTIEARRNHAVDIANSDSRMRLGRFTISGLRSINRQLTSVEARVSVSRSLYTLRSHRTRSSHAPADWA